MKNTTALLLKKFAQMSGEQKILIAMELSETVRKVHEAGAKANKTETKLWKQDNKNFLST